MSVPPTPNLPQEAKFDPQSKYTAKDYEIISQAEWRIADEVTRQLSPLVRMDGVYKGLIIEFVDYQTQELKDNHAVGLAWNDRNVNLIPSNIRYFDLLINSGIMSMELTHSVIGRLTGNRRKMNNVVHYLYNAGRLKTIEIKNDIYRRMLGQDMRLVVPDIAYGWINQDRIMYDIQQGIAPAGDNVYWPVVDSDFTKPITSTFHEVLHIREWLADQKLI